MRERIFVALDVETTGLVPNVDELIEVAAVKFRGDEIIDTFNQLIRPHQPLPLKITRLTGIRPEDVANAPRFNEVGTAFASFLKSYPLVGHSVSFDLGMLRAQGMNFSQPTYDTFELATLLLPQTPIYKLGALADQLGIEHPADHRALNDSLVTARVFSHLLGLISQLDLETLTSITRMTTRVPFGPRDLFEAALRERSLETFMQAPPVADLLKPLVPAVAEPIPLKPTGDARPISADQVAAFFASDGPLGREFPGYEAREPQVEMARAVAQAFEHGEPLLVEAGTGTGKSLAYLTPAAMFAARRGERVVVSTNTINLQDQLFFKDIPDLQRIMAHGDPAAPPFSAALLKGRSNYLCLKRYHELRRHENLSPEEVRMLLKVQLWLPTTGSGDKAELLLMDREGTAWNRVNVTAETCVGPRCPHFRECYFFRARRNAEAAHIVVINHALLIADLASDSHVLPPYDHVVVDEAHNLEDVATSQLSFTVDQAALISFLDELFQSGGAQIVSGLLSELPNYLATVSDPIPRAKIERVSEQLPARIVRARSAVYDCFNALYDFMAQQSPEGQYDPRLRLTPKLRSLASWQSIQILWQNLTDSLAALDAGLATILTELRELGDAAGEGFPELILRVEALLRFAVEVRINSGYIIFGDEDYIAWLTHERQRDTLSMTAAPLSVAEVLQAQLFAQKQTSILASATLTVAESFDFVKHRVGLPEAEELALESPFDYEQQAMLFLPTDIPEPNQRGYQQAVEQALIALCTATGGRTLALFTANSSLRQTYEVIQEPLEAQGIAVLGQNLDGSRRSLIERFKEFPRTVLLGTSSFWEGVDVVGDALSVLVIAKLPFSVPNDPIFAARSEEFERSGKRAFDDYSVPLSILRFKQGFGRLIRSREDRGIVVVLDKRLLSKKYGALFLSSLPHTRVRSGPLAQLPALAERFLAQR